MVLVRLTAMLWNYLQLVVAAKLVRKVSIPLLTVSTSVVAASYLDSGGSTSLDCPGWWDYLAWHIESTMDWCDWTH